MIVHYFQTKSITSTERPSLGYALLNFFNTYGYEYDYIMKCYVHPSKPMKNHDVMSSLLLQNMHINTNLALGLNMNSPMGMMVFFKLK